MKHMATKTLIAIASLMGGILLVGSAGSATRPAHYRLHDASPSVDALATRFLNALEKKDAVALARMCVSEAEYREFIIPGSVEKGAKPQTLTDKESEFFWQLLYAKSYQATVALLKGYGGKSYRLKEVVFEEGTSEYDWYVAYRDPAILVEADDGTPVSIPVGAIAEIDGQFKFIAMHEDD
jgi:hypothetical protein